jgi:predicted nucleotidyltransferase
MTDSKGVTSTRLSPATGEQLQEVVRRIKRAFDPQRILLFGSHAYGKPMADSDVDLLVVMESSERPAVRSAAIAKELLDIPFPMDILARTPDEIRYRLEIGDHFIREILERGEVLYERRVPERMGG